jgi:hypothetical protein
MATTRERLDKHDREIAAIRKLIHEGMRIVVQLGAAQKRTEQKLQTLIDTLQRSGNGHGNRKLDLQ